MNSVNIVGRFTKAPEARATQGGTVLSFCLAVDRGDRNKNTDFIDCVAFGKTAEFITQYFSKGDPIMVTGKLQTRTWERDDGTKQKAAEVYVSECGFVPRVNSNTDNAAQPAGGDVQF